MTGQITYSFIKAIIRHQIMFNCCYLHNYHLTIMPYFKMVRKVKALKKPGLGEILLSAMAGGPCVQLPKRIRIRRKIKRGAEVAVGWKVAAKGKWGLPGNLIQKSFFQTMTERPCLLQPWKIRIRVESMKKKNHAADLEWRWRGTTEQKQGLPKDLARRNVAICFVTLSLAHQKYKG